MIYVIACMFFNFGAIVYLLIFTYLQDKKEKEIDKELLKKYKSIIKSHEEIRQKSFIFTNKQEKKDL